MKKTFEVVVKSVDGEVKFLVRANRIEIDSDMVTIDDKPILFMWAKLITATQINVVPW